MNTNFTLKRFLFLLIFMLGATFSQACITGLSISADSNIDNGDGTCT